MLLFISASMFVEHLNRQTGRLAPRTSTPGRTGRYVILFMALFSLYTGLIYNEAFSIPLKIFGGTRWGCPSNPSLPLIDIRINEVRPGAAAC